MPATLVHNSAKPLVRQYSLRSTFWVKTVVASVAALLAVVTVLWRDWIERVFGIDPDHYSGSIEWELVIALLWTAVLFAALARREWSRASLASVENGSSDSSAIG